MIPQAGHHLRGYGKPDTCFIQARIVRIGVVLLS
jgi:hypothetical protein